MTETADATQAESAARRRRRKFAPAGRRLTAEETRVPGGPVAV